MKDYGLISSMNKKQNDCNIFYNEIKKPKYMFNHLNLGRLQVVISPTMLMGGWTSMTKQTYSSGQERNLRTYYMPHCGIFLIIFFAHEYH